LLQSSALLHAPRRWQGSRHIWGTTSPHLASGRVNCVVSVHNMSQPPLTEQLVLHAGNDLIASSVSASLVS
jgi:hypothetical protein